jgi:hypothetical protein
MKNADRAIARILEARFGKTEAQALLFGRARVVKRDIQFMDVKHLSELCERYRAKVRQQILAFRMWQNAMKTQSDAIARLYGAAEGAFIRQRISDDVKLWYFAHRDYHEMRKAYLMKIMTPRVSVEWRKAG